jgi:hypothetical protein
MSSTLSTAANLAYYLLVAHGHWRGSEFPSLFASYELAPFRGLHFVWLRLGLLLTLAFAEPAYLILVPIELAWKRHQLTADARWAVRAGLLLLEASP